MENSAKCAAKTRTRITPYAFIYGPGPRTNKTRWPDFWYAQVERRWVLTHLQSAYAPSRYGGFRPSTLYTDAEQVKTHVQMLHQGKRNNYLLKQPIYTQEHTHD